MTARTEAVASSNSQLRNVKYCYRPLDSGIYLTDWNLPERDVLELDYTSWLRPPQEVVPLDDSVFDDLLVALQNSMKTAVGKTPGGFPETCAQLQALRMTSHNFFLDCSQIRDILSTVDPEKEVRSEPLGASPKRRFALKGGSVPPKLKKRFQSKIKFLEMAHANIFSSIRKTAYQPLR